MANIGFDHFYCKKALQYIDLRLICNEPKQNLAPILEFSMWLSQQIPPSDHSVAPYDGCTGEKALGEHSDGGEKYSYTVKRWMSLKMDLSK